MSNKREIQEINASSMADIAFLLLIFFLVATTMNVDTGITRQLPPIPPEQQQQDIRVKERNLLAIHVNQYDVVSVALTQTDLSQITRQVKEFFYNANDDETKPEKKMTDIEMPDGSVWTYPISQGVVSLNSSRSTSYNVYLQVQNELTRALNEMRDELARQKFGAEFMKLTEAEQDVIKKAIPPNISEAEPRKEAGGR
ncbi:MAG: biopolymer transporter ExbD [Alistipes sp.]|jgi:biopolymer transport protein ExbD|nr:biopolymer transporter ExbD [Alistipes sp.]